MNFDAGFWDAFRFTALISWIVASGMQCSDLKLDILCLQGWNGWFKQTSIRKSSIVAFSQRLLSHTCDYAVLNERMFSVAFCSLKALACITKHQLVRNLISFCITYSTKCVSFWWKALSKSVPSHLVRLSFLRILFQLKSAILKAAGKRTRASSWLLKILIHLYLPCSCKLSKHISPQNIDCNGSMFSLLNSIWLKEGRSFLNVVGECLS